MSLFRRIQDRITSTELYDQFVLRKRVLMESDHSFVLRRFRQALGQEPDLENPKSFCEKITWLLLYYRPPHLIPLADKFDVRPFVQERIGASYLNEMLGLYCSTSEILWNDLPNKFVMKATHGSKWNLLCPEKNSLDLKWATHQMDLWLRRNFYWYGREWIYRDLPRRIIAEKYLTDADGTPPSDYKFFCFSGEPRLIQVDAARFTHHTRSFYSPSWQHLQATMTFPVIPESLPPPAKLDDMLEICRILSAGLPFVRVDLYHCRQQVLFGEMTFLPGRGLEPFEEETYNQMVGDWIQLPPPVKEKEFALRANSILPC